MRNLVLDILRSVFFSLYTSNVKNPIFVQLETKFSTDNKEKMGVKSKISARKTKISPLVSIT